MATSRCLSGSSAMLLGALLLAGCATAWAGSSSTDPGVECVASLAADGVLFEITATDLNVIGPCSADNAYGACTSSRTGAELYSVCSAECRAEVDKVSSDCVDALSNLDDSLAKLFERCQTGSLEPSDCDGTEPTPTAGGSGSGGGGSDATAPPNAGGSSTPADAGDCAAELESKGALFAISSSTGSTTSYEPSGACIETDAYGECTDGSTFCTAACRAEVAEVSATCASLLGAGSDGEIFTTLVDTCEGDGQTSCSSSGSPPDRPTARRSSPRPSGSALAPAPEPDRSTPGGACAAALADLGALYEASSSTGDVTTYQPAGPCIEDEAFGQCVNSRTNEPLFDYCSAGCREDLAQANSTCRAALADSLYFSAVLKRCDGEGATDCEGGDSSGSGSSSSGTPPASLPPLPTRPTSGGIDTTLDTPTRRPTASSAPTARAAAAAPVDATGPATDTAASSQHASIAACMGTIPLILGLAGGLLMLTAAA